MKKRLWIIIAALILVLLMVFRLAGNKRKINEKKTITREANVQIPVNVALVQEAAVSRNLVKTGTLVPYVSANITAAASGNLEAMNVNLGAQVSQGAVLARIDSRMLQLKLAAAQLQQQKLKKDFDRYTVLLQGEATTETNLQDIKFNLDNANNQISQIRKQLADNEIKAPVSGQIVSKDAEAGEFVNPGTVLGKIVDISRLKVDVLLGEQDAYNVHNGQLVRITTELYPGEVFEGKVIFISQQGDAAHNYQVQLALPNSKVNPLKAGTFVYADFSQQSKRTALQIPRSALVESRKNPFVYVVVQDKAVVRKISLGETIGDQVEVIDGLKAGEQVVVNGQINLTEGSPVRIAK